MIRNLGNICPFLHTLALSHCTGLRSFDLVGLDKLNNLKLVENNFTNKTIIKIDHAPSLQYLYCRGIRKGGRGRNHIHLGRCEKLEVLKIKTTCVRSPLLQHILSPAFPALKVLVVTCGARQTRMDFSSLCLEKLKLKAPNLNEIDIRAPSLRSFKFINNSDSSFPGLFSMDTTSLSQVVFSFYPSMELYASRFLKMREFLAKFNHPAITLNLLWSHKVTYHIPDNLEDNVTVPSLTCIKNLELKIAHTTERLESPVVKSHEALVDGLLWMCHPESIYLELGYGSNSDCIVAFIRKLRRHIYETRDCCSDTYIRCWRHDLEDFEMECLGKNGDRRKALPKYLNTMQCLAPEDKICFRLRWRTIPTDLPFRPKQLNSDRTAPFNRGYGKVKIAERKSKTTSSPILTNDRLTPALRRRSCRLALPVVACTSTQPATDYLQIIILLIEISGPDRFSELPVGVIHRILSFLPTTKDVVATSILSKSLLRAYSSFPITDFSASNYGCIDDLLPLVTHNPHSLDRIHLDFTTFLAIGHIPFDYAYLYPVPEILSSNCFACTSLSFGGCTFLALDASTICWPSLQVLSIDHSCVTDSMIRNLGNICPLLHTLTLSYCTGLRSFNLVGHDKLNNLKLVDNNFTDNTIIKIDHAPSLQCLYCRGIRNGGRNHIHLGRCEKLEVLKIKTIHVHSPLLLHILSPTFPVLKVLVVTCGARQTRADFSSPCLEKLKLKAPNLKEIDIRAPSLRSFKFINNSDSSFPGLFSMDTTSLSQVVFSSYPSMELYASRFLKMREFLAKFNHPAITLNLLWSRRVTFHIPDIFKGNVAVPSLPCIKNLELKIAHATERLKSPVVKSHEALVDGLLWMCHPESIYLELGYGSNSDCIVAFIRKLRRSIYEPRDCCSYTLFRCWRHDLEDFEMECLGQNGDRKALRKFLNTMQGLAPEDKICFRLRWRTM
ncbi:hypothetical protein Tsubulata_032065 [Turnera subulata]|uniref:F-box/LRR-repeat protein 15/At3g58940/PEG3-like LRR domain-containing protein n=1 Tax=Turnera subulata TaxID=218843 RepID=A0A9Q0J6A1_9ROSI|nr:hypothetical protein Tsubulata_032065 [Turnera subulata]